MFPRIFSRTITTAVRKPAVAPSSRSQAVYTSVAVTGALAYAGFAAAQEVYMVDMPFFGSYTRGTAKQ